MPKNTPELDSLVAKFVTDLDAFVDEAVTSRVGAAFDDLLRQVFNAPRTAPIAPAKVTPRATPTKAVTPAKATPVAQAGRKVRLCPVPGCGKPAAGPKYQWKCREHGVLKSGKQPAVKVAAAPPTTSPTIELPKPKTPTVIPANVTITRLPPGPVPRERQERNATAALCRLPGCRNKHSGPRFDLFCRDHYAQLNAEERKKYKELWRTQHAVA